MDLSKQDLLTMLIRAERGVGLADVEVTQLRELLEACPHCLRVSRVVRRRTTIRMRAPREFESRLRSFLAECQEPTRGPSAGSQPG